MEKSKKILLFIDNLGSGGAQRQICNVGVLLKKSGYDVEVLVYQDYPFYKPLLDANQIPITLVETKGKVSRIVRIRKYINKVNPYAVIAFLETPCFIACISKIFGKKWKLITTERSAKETTFNLRRNKFFNLFERFSSAKVANSYNAIKMWRKYYPQYNKKYSVIYNPIIIPNEFTEIEHDYKEDNKIKLVVAASYQELKNPLGVIEALNLLTDEQKKKIEINWYGRAEIEIGNTRIFDLAVEKVQEYGLENLIHLNGETKEIYKKMAESDVVGLFSTVEGLPNVICEGMTIGRPIVMSKVSDFDVLVNGNGYLCDPHSVESIRDALVNLIETPADELAKMGEKSKEKAKELFSAEVIKKQWIDIIENIPSEGWSSIAPKKRE